MKHVLKQSAAAVVAGAAGMAADAAAMAVAGVGVAAMVAVAGAAAIAATVAIAGKQTFRVRIAASRFQRGVALLSPRNSAWYLCVNCHLLGFSHSRSTRV